VHATVLVVRNFLDDLTLWGWAVRAAGLTGPDGTPLRVVPHQLRHTFSTTLVNAGMSLQALMALLG
jgi:site-specific recombinase XerD